MSKKRKYVPGWQLREKNEVSSQQYETSVQLDKLYKELEQKEDAARERERQRSEEIEKRAAEMMANIEQTKAEAVEESPRLQLSSFIPTSDDIKEFIDSIVPQRIDTSSITRNLPKTEKPRKTQPKQKHEAEKYYPSGLFDTEVPTVGFDSKTGSPQWGTTTMKQEMDRINTIKNIPETLRTNEDQEYYNSLKRSYLDNSHPIYNKVQQFNRNVKNNTSGPWQSKDPHKNSWLDNAIGLWGMDKNETEISSYAGDILKNQELRGYVQQVADYQNVVEKLVDAKEKLENLGREEQNNTVDQNLYKKVVAAQQNYIADLTKQAQQLKKQADVATTYLNSALADIAPDRDIPIYTKIAQFAMGEYRNTPVQYNNGKYNPKIQTLVDKLSEEINNPRTSIQQLSTTSYTLKNILDQAVQRFDKEDEFSREGMRKNMEELDKWKKSHPVDKDFIKKARESQQDLSFLDPDTYLYGLPGVLGSSAAFNGLQWANTALSTTGGLLASSGAGAPIGFGLAGIGMGLGVMSGARENAAEVYENVSSVFGDKLRNSGKMEKFLSDAEKQLGRKVDYDEALREMMLGNVKPSVDIQKTLVNSTFGANNLFKHDMFAVTADNLFESIINFIPYGKIAEASLLKPLISGDKKISKLRRLAQFKQATKHLNEAAYNLGATINPVVGVGTALIGAVTRPIRKPVADFVSKHASEALIKKFGTIADWAIKAPKTLLNAKVIGRSGKDWLGRILSTSFSEAMEEGKQYYNGKQFAAGNYAGESDSWWDVLLGDIEGGSKSTLQFTGSFLGLGTDKEWIANMRGGFLAGGGHTAIVSGVGNVRGAIAQISANNLVINNILATKLEERARLAKGAAYAKKSSMADRQAMMKAFDDVKALQQRITEQGDPENEGVAPELIEDQRKMYNRIFNLANSSSMRHAAEKRGIEVGSNRYNTLVSLVDFAQQEGKDALQKLQQKQSGIRDIIQKTLFNQDIEDADPTTLQRLVEEFGVTPHIPSITEYGPGRSGEWLAAKLTAQKAALQNIDSFVDYIAHLDALMTQRDQIELKDVKTTADKRKLRSLNKQIDSLRNSVKTQKVVKDSEGKEKIVLEDSELSRIATAQELQKYVYDTELHEIVRDQYRDVNNLTIDLDHANALIDNLVGDDVEGARHISIEQENELLGNISSQLTAQAETTEALTDNKNVKVKDGSIEQIAVDEKAAKKANKVIDDYLNALKSDEQFEQEIHDDLEKALDELYGKETETQQEVVTEEEPSPEVPPQPIVEPQPTEMPSLPEEMTAARREIVNDLADYIDTFPLRVLSEDEAENLPQDIKDHMKEAVDMMDQWTKTFSSAVDNKGTVDSTVHEAMMTQLAYIQNYANFVNTEIDAHLTLQASSAAVPETITPQPITNEDVIDSQTAEHQKYIDNVRSAIQQSLGELQDLLISSQEPDAGELTQEAIADIRQQVANMDALLRSEEGAEAISDVYDDWYNWYFGTDDKEGARDQILALTETQPEQVPEPNVPVPPETTSFDTSFMDDPENWGLFTNTRWSRPGVGNGIVDAVATDDANIKLSDCIGEHNFLTDATFELVLMTTPGMRMGNQPFVIVHYKGHMFTPVFIQTAANQNRQKGYAFWNAIRQARKGDGQIVIPLKVSRTLGKEKRTDDNGNLITPRSLFDVGLITEDDMYELEFSVNQDVFGITEQIKDPDGTPRTVVYTPSFNGKGHQPIYPYSNSNHSDKPAPGVPIMLIDRHFDELGNRKARVPVNIMFTKLTVDDATLIADILKGKHCADRNKYGVYILQEEYVQMDERGNLIGYGITNGEVLNLLMRYGYRYPDDRKHVHLEYNSQDNRRVSIVGFIDGVSTFDPNKPTEIPSKEYDLFDENELNSFIQSIAGVINRNFDQNVAASRVGEQNTSADSTNPFRRLNQKRQSSLALQDILRTKGKIQFGNSSIEFDEKDFAQAGNSSSEGVSGIVWYVRHGFLKTRFNGFENTILVFDEDAGVKVVNQETPSGTVQEQNNIVQETAVDDIQPQKHAAAAEADESPAPIRKKDRINLIDDDELAKEESALPSDAERINIETAKQNIIRLLGENGFKVIEEHQDVDVETMINMFKNGKVSLGAVKNMFIHLSKYARKGTEYHEVFHIVTEILLSDKEREKVYKAYAKAKKIKLYNDDGSLNVKASKLVTEGLADEFMLYEIDRPTIKLTWNIKQLWHSIQAWTKFYNNIGSYRLWNLYKQVNSGKFKNVQPTKEGKERFAKLLETYKEKYLPFSVQGKAMQHIASVRQYKNLCKTMVYILFQSQKNIDRAGRNMQDFQMDDAKIIREYPLFKKYAQQNPALKELLDNWNLVRSDVRTLVSQISTPYIGTNENEENVEDMQGDEESVANAGIGDYTRDSQEFSQFSRAGEKVKFFFSIIPNVTFKYNNQGVKQRVSVNNAEGLPEFVKPQVMYNTVLNQVYNCRSLADLISRLESLGKENAKFDIICERIKKLKKGADEGNVEDATLLTQILVNLHASKGEYVICRASKDKTGFNLIIQSTDTDYEAKNYRREWSSLFAGGAGKYIAQNANSDYVMKGNFKPSVFTTVAQYLIDFADAVSPLQRQLKIAVLDNNNNLVWKVADVTNPEDFALAKAKFISLLNALGITFTTDMLNYMLATKYGGTDYVAMNKFFSDTYVRASNGREINVGVRSFAAFVAGFNNNGKLNIVKTNAGYSINGQNIQNVFSGKGAGFVGQLATWAYNYKKSQDQLSILANKQNRQYLISENNYITDTIDELNAAIDGDTSKIDDLKTFVYNWPQSSEDSMCSSIILRNYTSKNPKRLRFVTDSGFKTDSKGDIGEDYSEISPAQDEVSKIQMLLQGKLILPTMSDKKTWGYIDGLRIPGINMELPITGQFLNSVEIRPNGSYIFSQNPEVLDQLRQYAILEHRAVLQTLQDVKGYTDENGIYHEPLKDSDKIQNYHKAKVTVNGKEYYIIQGARYSTIYSMFTAKGKKIHFNRVCDENGKFISEEDNIALASEYFFGVPSQTAGMFWIHNEDGDYIEVNSDKLADIQRKIIARSLQKQLRKQLEKAEHLGLIEKINNADSYIYSFKNKLLDQNTVLKIKQNLPNNLSDQQKESLAIAIIMNDVSCKSIISLQETERIFSGHPAFCSWKYNSKGYLSDRSTDQHKRFGGLVSTGKNNAFVFAGMPTTYTAAEINDVNIGSPNIETIEKIMYEGELRSTYMRKMLQEGGITIEDGDTDEAKEIANKADSESIESIENALQGVVLDVVKKRAAAKINAFRKGINVANGATYITDDMCENLLKQVGDYGEDVQRAFKVLRGEEVNGRKYTAKDTREMLTAYSLIQSAVIGTQKYTAYGFRKQNGILVPYYNKTALFPLFKTIASGNMAKLYAKMKKDKVDMVMLNSSVKVGSQGSQDIDFDALESDDFKFNTYTQEYKYLRKQFNTDPKEKEMMAMGTQMTKMIMSSMLAGRDYIITNPDGSKRKVNVKNLRDEIMQSINKLAEKGYDKLRKQLFDGNKLDIRKFSKFLTDELSSRGASRELLRAISVVDENTPDIDEARKSRIKETGKPELRVPLAALSGLNWIQSVINAKVNKSVIDINTPGAAFIQRSAFGIEGKTKSDIITQNELSPDIYEGRDLQVRNENGSMDCVLSIDFFANIIPENLSFEEAKQWLIDNKVISGRLKDGTWSNADASIIGSRIPTQAQSSIHALRCVDVLPVVRDTIILPKEFTKITGSDFDIDKIFLSTVHYKKNDVKDISGNILSRTISKEFKEDSEEYYANRLILDYISLLKDSKSEDDTTTRSMQIGDASIDNDTELLTSIVEDLEGGIEEDLDTYDTYSLWRNTSVRDQFITGKFGIGPFALNNNNHILTMLYGVKFANVPGSILDVTGHESLHDAEDMYGESIMSWLSGLISAHVDVAKDPYISKLNVNKYTYNLINLMVRTGFGKMTFYFMTQPIMKELALRVNNAASAYGNKSNKSKFRRQKEAEEEFMLDYINKTLNPEKEYTSIENALEGFKKLLASLGTSKTALFQSMFDKKSEFLRQIAKSKDSMHSDKQVVIDTPTGKVLLTMQQAQILVYLAKTELDEYSNAISQLVKYCKIDTKKQGKNISEQRDFMRGYNRLFRSPRSKLRKMFDETSLQNLRKFSYIETKTSKATNLFLDILRDQLIDATYSFNATVESVLVELPVEDDNVTEKLARKVSDTIMVSIRSGFFNNYANKNNIDIRGLVNGENAMYERLNRLKIAIQTEDRYAELRNQDGVIDNYLLNLLTSGYSHKQIKEKEQVPEIFEDAYPDAKFLSVMTFLSDDSVDADEISEAWEELLEDSKFPELQQFARDLIVYSFITTGGNGSSNNIFKYIPTSWLVNPDGLGYEQSFAYYMQQKLDTFNTVQSGKMVDIDEVILNNWEDEQFIPTIDLTLTDTFYTGRVGYDIVNGRQVNPQTDIPIIIRTRKIGSRFIKIRRQYDPESQRSVAIYKAAKIASGDIIYVLVEPKGQNFGGKNKIYEFGRIDSNVSEVEKQLRLNTDLMVFAESLGANLNSIEDVLTKLISFVESKTTIKDRKNALDLASKYGVTDTLLDIIKETTGIDEEDLENSVEKLDENISELPENNKTKRVYQSPEITIKSISTEEPTASDLSDKQKQLGLNENNDQNPNYVTKERPYDSSSQYSEFKYLASTVKDYIKNKYGIKDHQFVEYIYSFIVKGLNTMAAKFSVADTGGYVNDFSFKSNKNGVVITPRHSDMLTKDKMAKLGKNLEEQCNG